MKKIVFATLPLKRSIEKRKYPVDGNALIESDEPIYFAINPAVANSLQKDDEIKVILLETKGGENAGMENAKIFIDELNSFNKVGAKISKEILPNAFDPSKTNFQHMFKALIKELEEGAEIYADVVEALFNYEPRFEATNVTVVSMDNGHLVLDITGKYLVTGEDVTLNGIEIQ